jgi:hypothetical protein
VVEEIQTRRVLRRCSAGLDWLRRPARYAVMRVLRRIRGVEVKLSRQQAIKLARAESERRGWPWTEPVAVSESVGHYRIWTNRGRRGGNVIIRVDVETGEIKHASYAAR